MTRLFQSGFESGTYSTEFPGGSPAALTIVTSPVHYGTYAAKFTGAGYVAAPVPAVDAAILRWYHRIDSASIGAASRLGGLLSSTGHLATLRLRTDRQLELIQDGPPYGMVSMQLSGFQVPVNEWVCLELLVDVTNLLVAARYNGATWAIRSALVNFASAGMITQFYIGSDEATTTGCNHYYDDVAVNSFAGRTNCWWPGMVIGTRNYPPTADAEAGWTATTGTPLYQQVNETIPDAADYVGETAHVDGAALGFYVDVDLEWPISAIMVGCYMNSFSGVTPVQFRAQWHDPSNAAGVFGANIDPPVSANETRYPVLTIEEAWDGSRRVLNSGFLRRGESRLLFVRIGAGDRHLVISTVWVVIEYAMSVAAQPLPHPYPPQPQILVELEP